MTRLLPTDIPVDPAPVDAPRIPLPPLRLPPGIPIDPSLLEPYLDALIKSSDTHPESENDAPESSNSSGSVQARGSDNSESGATDQSQVPGKTPESVQSQLLVQTSESIQAQTPDKNEAPEPEEPFQNPPLPARPLPPPPKAITQLHIRRRPLPYIYTLPPPPPPVLLPTTPTAPTEHTPDLYKNYLHKLPHTRFTEHAEPGICLACDTATTTYHTCDACGLALCSICHYLITEEPIRGSLRLLIQHAARWKLGYSKEFLEREREEREKEQEAREKFKEREAAEEESMWRNMRGVGGSAGIEETIAEDEDEEDEEVIVMSPVNIADGIEEMIQRMERERFPNRELENGDLERMELEEGEVEEIVL